MAWPTLPYSQVRGAEGFYFCTLEGRSKYIVSRDNDLLRLGQYDSVQIVDDAEFLGILTRISLEETNP